MKMAKITGLLLAGLVCAGSCFTGVAASAVTFEENVQAAADVEINDVNFPDENFRKYVSEKVDTDGNGKLSENEIERVVYMYC